jgi:carboxypeptidase Taq
MGTAMSELKERLAEIADLSHAGAVLHWDQNVMMPGKGSAQRGDALATLARIEHDRFIAADTGRLLEAAASEVDGLPEDSDEARLVSKTQRDYDKARRVPSALAADLAKAASSGYEAWVAARTADDFNMFAPFLQHNLDLTREYVDCFDEYDAAYDVVLDDYEPGGTSTHVRALFDELKTELVPLIAELREREVDPSPLHVTYPVAGQRQLADEVLRRMGFSDDCWRFDDTVHPFATSFGSSDVRITSRFDGDYYPMGLYGAMHECGHGLYEQGVAEALQRTSLSHPPSLALHESQSRMWENFVGRGRAFNQYLTPRLVQLAGGALDGVQADAVFKALNAVNPSLIRIEADETTYSMHIVLRFELEQELLEDKLTLAELPEAWNSRMRDYLGIEVPSDADGVMQDVHWSAGLIGYFPTYALGNLVAGQLWEKIQQELPDLDAQIAAGELSELREWLRENVHRHGGKFSSQELLERVVGEPIAVGPFVRHLKTKLSDVYELPLA